MSIPSWKFADEIENLTPYLVREFGYRSLPVPPIDKLQRLAAVAVGIIAASETQRFYTTSYVYASGLVVSRFVNPNFFVRVELANAIDAIR